MRRHQLSSPPGATRTATGRPEGRARLIRRVGVVALLVGVVGACGDGDDDASPADPCRATIDEAGAAAEINEQVALLDRALVICASPSSFAAHVDRHPTLLGWDVDTYLTNRCASGGDDVRRSRICTSDEVAPVTTAAATAPDIFYVGTTLDGREVEIRPRPGRPFEDGVPQVIVDMPDIAIQFDCEGMQAEHERWLERVDDPQIGDEASVYAQHALDVAAFIGCDPLDE